LEWKKKSEKHFILNREGDKKGDKNGINKIVVIYEIS